MINGIYNIKSLFALGDVQQLVIPEVQRDYVWEEKNCYRLFHSIKHGFDNRKVGMPEYINSIPDDNAKADLENKYIEDNSRINLGFIYAYHDSDYIGKQFIIDGQQRFTTMYLILLACYIKAGKQTEFKTKYFKNNVPKLDYKVRESSHDFIVELIKDQCSGNSIDAIEERFWWRPDFDIDITIRNLKNNYTFLFDQLGAFTSDELQNFTKYLEVNIDFKFFDIKISEQGEQLYLFMNSRGLRLSFQEKIRAEIIAKHGLECGDFWEEAQQYFWQSKQLNKDAELGFNEFLKWIVIINIATENKDFDKHKNLISRPTTEEQFEFLESYIIDNIESFDRQNIEGLFNATKYFFSIKDIDSIQNNPEWLTSPDGSIMPMRTYLKFLPIIYYIFRKQGDEGFNKSELRRVSAFIINCNQSRTYQKNPQLYLINFIRFIKNLCDNKTLNSITDFDVNSDEFIGRDFCRLYFDKFNSFTTGKDKSLFEDFVIKMIVEAENNKILDYLHGDYRVVIESVPLGKTIPESILDMETYRNKLNWFIDLGFNTQRKLLLTFGDYAFSLSDIKCDFGQDKVSWCDIFTNQPKFDILKSFLNCHHSLDDFGIQTTINTWVTNNPLATLNDNERYRYYLIKYDFDTNYFAWGRDINEFSIRIHTVRKSGYNSSIDILNNAVTKSLMSIYKRLVDIGIDKGWVDGSRDQSQIKISKNNQLYISMQYQPNNLVSGKWVLKNMLDISNTDYTKMNNLIITTPQINITNADDIVDFGKNILCHLIPNI